MLVEQKCSYEHTHRENLAQILITFRMKHLEGTIIMHS